MADSKKQIQQALLEGVAGGLSGEALLQFVKRETKAKSKKIVHAAFFALSDPDLKDRKALDVLFELGLSYRLRAEEEDQSAEEPAPSKAATLPLPEKSKKKSKKAEG